MAELGGWLIVIIIFALMIYASKHAFEDYQASRDARIAQATKGHPDKNLPDHERRRVARAHAAGFWGGELAHGFPAARHSIWAGWYAHVVAREQAKQHRDTGEATAAEAEATRTEQAKEAKDRTRQARERIDAAVKADPELAGKPVRQRVKQAAATVLAGAGYTAGEQPPEMFVEESGVLDPAPTPSPDADPAVTAGDSGERQNRTDCPSCRQPVADHNLAELENCVREQPGAPTRTQNARYAELSGPADPPTIGGDEDLASGWEDPLPEGALHPEISGGNGSHGGTSMNMNPESGDSFYQGAQASLASATKDAAAAAASAEQFEATSHGAGFMRDTEYAQRLGRLQEALRTVAAEADGLNRHLVARHQAGAEYHEQGGDANAEGFRNASAAAANGGATDRNGQSMEQPAGS